MVSDPSNAATMALPIQRPGEQATQKIRLGGTAAAGTSAPSPADAQPTVPERPRPQQAPGSPQSAAAQQQPVEQPPRTIATPQRIPGSAAPVDAPVGSAGQPNRSKRRLLIAGAAAAVIVVLIVVVVVLVNGSDNSPEAKVKAAITTYTKALESGNLPALEAATCGAQHDFYLSMANSPDQYASVHKLAADQRKIPKLDSVDSVQITGDKAVAQASVYTDADSTRTARTFDLQNTADGWKVCDLPNATQ